MSDLELPIRGRTYREPEGQHSVAVRGRDLEPALQHVASRADCRNMAVIGLPEKTPALSVMAGRRMFITDGDATRLHDFTDVALQAGVDIEWLRATRPPFERLADALLPAGAVVLAAGSGSRMPGPEKLLLEFDGKPMVRNAIEAASEGGCQQIVVVYSSDAVKKVVDGAAELVHNARAHTGMASSLQAGLRSLRPDMEAAVVMLGDQPLVGSRSVAALLRAWRREGSRPAVALAAGGTAKWTPPVVLSRELWDDVYKLTGDAGARQIFDPHPELLDLVPSPDRLDDIDTPEDYANIVRLFPHEKPPTRA